MEKIEITDKDIKKSKEVAKTRIDHLVGKMKDLDEEIAHALLRKDMNKVDELEKEREHVKTYFLSNLT